MKPESVPALILAAGHGTRLAPVTTLIPKPMIPLPHGDSLLGTIVSLLERAGIREFAVNTHYLPDQIEHYMTARLGNRAHLYFEPVQLGTGGPLVNAREFLSSSDCFVLYNGDILCDADISELIRVHREQRNLVTMALSGGPERRIVVESDGRILDLRDLIGAKSDTAQRRSYAGIAVISPDFFRYLPASPEPFDLILGVVEAVRKGERIGGWDLPEGTHWYDLGTVENYLTVAESLPEVFKSLPAHGATFKRLAEQGSQRRFYRLTTPEKRAVLMVSFAEDADFERFIAFGTALHEVGAGTPELYGWNVDERTVLMEDLGDTMLWDAAQGAAEATLSALYAQAAGALIDFQAKGTACANALDGLRVFDAEYLRWETSYFYDNLLKRHFGIQPSPEQEAHWFAMFDRLAKRVDAQPKIVMHRDCQSQNLMLHEGGIRFVDYQGARLGPVGYDLASLLLDPYLDLPDAVIESAFQVYAAQLCRLPGCETMTPDAFREMFTLAAIQRLMQALGAFGFLAHVRGKRKYLDAIPPALSRLRRIAQSGGHHPVLSEILEEIDKISLKK